MSYFFFIFQTNLKPNLPLKPTFKNRPHVKSHSNQLAQVVHEVLSQYGPHGPLG